MADVEEPVVEETFEEPEAEEEEYVTSGGATEVKLFGKWSFDEIEIRDISLEVNMPNCYLLEKRVHLCS